MQKCIYTFNDNHGKAFSNLGVEGIFLSIQQISHSLVKCEECHESQVQGKWPLVALFVAAVESLCHVQPCCNPVDCRPPDFFVHGIFLAKILQCIAIFFSRGSLQPKDWICVSCIGKAILHHWAGSCHYSVRGSGLELFHQELQVVFQI